MQHRDLGERVSAAMAGLAVWSSRNAKAVLLVVLLSSVVFAYGATQITTNVDVAEVLPRGDFNTTAAHLLTDQFKSAFTQQITLQFHIDEATGFRNWERDNERLENRRGPPFSSAPARTNITDEVYVRAMRQAIAFMQAYTRDEGTPLSNSIALPDFYSLINWTLEGGQDAPRSAFSLPGTDAPGEARYMVVDRAAVAAIPAVLDAVSSPSWTQTAVLLMPEVDEDASQAEIGRNAIAARDAYLAWAEATPEAYKVFTGDNKPLFTVELPIANAHSSELVREDFTRLLPIIAVFILVMLYIAFRNVGAVVVSFAALTIGTLWTYGIEGFLGIPLNPLNLTLMPLIMGVGIDYAIHVTNEFQEHKSTGDTNAEAFRKVGARAGMALFIATTTTALGVGVIMFSPSKLINDFALLASIAIVIMFLMALVFLPAALTLWPGADRLGGEFRPSAVFPAAGRAVSKARLGVFVAAFLITVAAVASATTMHNEPFGDPGRNYLQDDPVRIEHERGLRGFYEVDEPDVKANVITFVGDMTDPQAHEYMRRIEASLRNHPDTIIPDTLRTIPFLLETWLTVKGGGPGALTYLAQDRAGGAPYPDTREEIKSEFDQLYASPVAQLGSIFTNGPDGGYDLGVMTFSARAATYQQAVEVWGDVWRSIEENAEHKPDGLKVAFVGNTATNYLFVAKEVPWVGYMGIAANAILLVLLILFFGDLRSILAVMAVTTLTSAWWLGLLPLLGIGMAITLVLPLVFITAIGTDYAVHLAWGVRRVQDTWQVFRTVGKAILFSFFTTTGPFLIFTRIQDLSVRKTMTAATLAFVIILLVTLLVIPVFFRVGRHAGAGRFRRPPVRPTAVDRDVGLAEHRPGPDDYRGPHSY